MEQTAQPNNPTSSDNPTSSMKAGQSFKEQFSLEERKAQYQRIIKSNVDRIPVIVERAPLATTVPQINKNKFLVPGDLLFAEFLYLIRKRIKLGNEQALFIYVNGTLPATSANFSSVYEEFKDEDGFLYVVYTGESSFGRQ